MNAIARPTRRGRAAGLLVVALAVMAGAGAVPAQDLEKGKGLKLNQPSKRANGSANTLTGPVCVYNIFIDDKTSAWTNQEQNAVRARVAAAAAFIEGSAAKYDRRVKFNLVYKEGVRHPKGLPTDLFVDPLWTEEVIKEASGVSGNDLVAALKKDQRADQVVVLLHINKESTSYSLAFYEGVDQVFAAERAVCFNRYPGGAATVTGTYVFQILSSFGAPTLYFPFDKDDTRKKQAQTLFPDDVMFRVDVDLTRLNIGAYTAYRVGWVEKLAEEYKGFED